MRSRAKSAKLTVSNFQQKFEKQQIYKRNKRYINLEQMNSSELEYSILRRKPLNTDDEKIHNKFHSSFTNSTAELSDRLEKDISRAKSRFSLSARGNMTCRNFAEETIELKDSFEVKPPEQMDSKQKIRSFSMQKMTSREYHHNLRNKPCNDQRLFNNFSTFSSEAHIACDFDTMKGKVLDNTMYHINDINYETQKLYEKYYYNNSSTYCKVDYKAERRHKKGRKFFESKRTENLPATELDWQKVDKGAKIATLFKETNIAKNGTAEFFRGPNKNLPSQSDMRYMNELTNHWVDETGRIPKKKLDYSTRKMKEDMTNERKQKIKNSKVPSHDRDQMCDARFFKVVHK